MRTSYQSAQSTPDPPSPWFARVADQYLGRGEAVAALRICAEGISHFPGYATGNLILGKCYQALNRHIEALIEFRKVLRTLPDNGMIRSAVEAEEEREREEFRAFAESQIGTLKGKGSLKFEQYLAENRRSGADPIDSIVQQLQEARRIVPLKADSDADHGSAPDTSPNATFVTPTLAEIYATQGEYKEAIVAYKALQEQRPEEIKRYQQRMAELEELLRIQLSGGG